MDSRSSSALQAFVDACRNADSGAGPVTACVEKTQLHFAKDCRGHLGLLEVRQAPECDAPGPLRNLADWHEIAAGRLWIGIRPDQSRIIWQPLEGNLRWIANTHAHHTKTADTIASIVEALMQPTAV
jgi:hypothetical protein